MRYINPRFTYLLTYLFTNTGVIILGLDHSVKFLDLVLVLVLRSLVQSAVHEPLSVKAFVVRDCLITVCAAFRDSFPSETEVKFAPPAGVDDSQFQLPDCTTSFSENSTFALM